MKISLGDRAKDSITGFEGIVVARTEWLSGCDRLTLQPEKLDKEGGVKLTQTFDETQLIVTKAGAVKPMRVSSVEKPGGPRPEPVRQSTPR
jgi:hypothetical protein